MTVIVGLATLLLTLAFWGCTRGPERQWYKIGQHYTTAEFERDKAECTREKKLDFDCMRKRGWVDVTPERETTPAAQRPPATRY